MGWCTQSVTNNSMLRDVAFGFVLCVLFNPLKTHSGFTTTKIGPRPLWNATYTDKLRQDLLLNYDKFARPTSHNNTTSLQFGLSIRHVDVNEFKSTITVYGFARLIWNDDKLKWNESQYGGIGKVHMADHEIWQPDMFLYNSAVSTGISHYNFHCLVYSNGQILWVPSTQFTALCDLNLKYWPFDTQKCELLFGSWTHHGYEIDLQLYNNKAAPELGNVITSTEWTIGETSMELELKKYDCCEEPYPLVRIIINLIRRSPSYKALIVTPAFVIICLILSTFWLPPQAGEKIILNGCTAIIISLFLLYFTQKIPAMGSHTPLIVFFYSSCLWIVSFSIIDSIVVLWLSRTYHAHPIPWIIKQPLTGWLGKWLGLRSYIKNSVKLSTVTAEEMRDHQVTDFEDNSPNDDKQFLPSSKVNEQYQNDWVLLAVAIDRISFIFYSFLFLILSFSYHI